MIRLSRCCGLLLLLALNAFAATHGEKGDLKADVWHECDVWLARRLRQDPFSLNDLLKYKFLQRILFRGSSLGQPKLVIGVLPDPKTEARALNRTRLLYRQSLDKEPGPKRGMRSTYWPQPSVTVAQVIPSPYISSLSLVSLEAIARDLQSGKLLLPLVYKRNLSVIGSGVIFLEDIPPHQIRVVFSIKPGTTLGLFSNHKEGIDFLRAHGQNYREFPNMALGDLMMDTSSPTFVRDFVEFFSLVSIDQPRFYDPGIFESAFEALSVGGQAFETRYQVLADLARDEYFFDRDRVSPLGKKVFVDEPFSKFGASAYFANITGRREGGAHELAGPAAFEPLIRAFPVLKTQMSSFQTNLNARMASALRLLVSRLGQMTSLRQKDVLWAEMDFAWGAPDAQGYPTPLLVEAHLSLVGAEQLQEGRAHSPE